MKIADVDCFVCRAPLRKPIWSIQPWREGYMRVAHFIESVIVKISSSDGLEGYGQAVGVRFHGPDILFIGSECEKLVDEIVSPKIKGESYFDNEVLWRRLHGALKDKAYGRTVLSAVDVALWDLKGKALGVPVYRLLGGAYRKKIRLYASKVPGIANINDDEEINVLAERLKNLREEGYTSFKIGGGLGVEADVESVRVARETVGAECKIMLDTACVYSFKDALRLGRSLQDLDVKWFETPSPAYDMESYVKLSRELDVKIATDAHPEPGQICRLLSRGGVDVVLSDVTAGGGITVSKRIVELTDLYNVEFSTHVGWHVSAVGYAASAHLSASAPNLNFQEGRIHFRDNPLGNPILKTPLKIEDGYLYVPDGAGLGIEVDEEALMKYRIESA